MAQYQDWYSIELNSYLLRRLPDEQRHDAVREVRNHLSEHVEELIGKGMDPTMAEKAAIRAFGDPRKAAVNLIPVGNRTSRLGGYLTTIGGIAMAFLMFSLVFFSFDYMMMHWTLGDFRYLAGVLFGTMAVLGAALVFGTLLTRKVPATKLATAWVAGVIVCAGYLFFGPEVHFANVPPTKLASKMEGWRTDKAANLQLDEITRQITKIVDKYPRTSDDSHRYFQDNSDRKAIPATEKAADLDTLKNLAIKATAVKADYVAIDGTKSAGYLVPQDGMPRPPTSYYSGPQTQYVYTETGTGFPFAKLNLTYTTNPDVALQAWQNSGYFSFDSGIFKEMASRQSEFMRQAEMISGRSRAETAGIILGALVASSLPILLLILAVSWLLTRIPVLTVRTSFRRRTA